MIERREVLEKHEIIFNDDSCDKNCEYRFLHDCLYYNDDVKKYYYKEANFCKKYGDCGTHGKRHPKCIFEYPATKEEKLMIH